MKDFFLQILELSLAASWLVPLVLLLRLVLKKAPRFLVCVLWGMVALRLLMPMSVESPVSMHPGREPFEKLETEYFPQEHTPADQTPNLPETPDVPTVPQGTPSILQTAPVETDWMSILSWSWLAGVCAMTLYGGISYLRLRRKVRASLQIEERVYLCDNIGYPFLLGVIRPRIYLPSGMEDGYREYVLAHEKAHLRRGDHLWKPFGFVLLAVHWFNPLLWAAYFFLCRDIETACDEKVIREMDHSYKASYSRALVACSLQGTFHRKWLTACPVAFGETGVKSRVKGVLSYKKPAFWVLLLAVIACIAVGVFFLTDPPAEETESSAPPVAEQSSPAAGEESAKSSDDKEENTPEPSTSILLWLAPGEEEKPSGEITLPEFPGVTFLYRNTRSWDEEIVVSRDGEETLIFSGGMPITQAVFADLNGDGKRELMLSYYFGSGFISSHVFIYDYAAQKEYLLGERGRSDCTLAVGSDAVYVAYYPAFYHPNSSAVLNKPVLVEKGGETVVELLEPFAQDSDGTAVAIGHTFTKKNPVDEMDKIPSITLYADCTFFFQFGVLSSYSGHGNFLIENGQLVLYTRDWEYTYRFDIVEDTLVFREEGSSDMDWYANLYDGCIFQ